jgi:hypothetical protein
MTKHGMTSHHIAQKRRSLLSSAGKFRELSFGIVTDAYWSTFWKKGNDHCRSLRLDAQQTSS